jgi:hypothetical protein
LQGFVAPAPQNIARRFAALACAEMFDRGEKIRLMR